MRPLLLAAAALAAGLTLTFAAAAPASAGYRYANSAITTPCALGTKTVDADWYFPDGGARGLIWLEHGFGRSNDALHDLGSKLSAEGYVVFAPTLPSLALLCGINSQRYVDGFVDAFGRENDPSGPLLRSARAAAATIGVSVSSLPHDLAFVGHSAGGSALTYAADQLRARFPATFARLHGVLLLDPVESIAKSMQTSLPGIVGRVPILTVSGQNSICNSNTSGTTELLKATTGFAGVRLSNGHHTDAEGGSTDLLGTTLCGKPDPVDVAVLQTLARGWLDGWFSGSADPALYPGGAYLEAQRQAGVLVTLPS
jgi:dienelactone hydrolase